MKNCVKRPLVTVPKPCPETCVVIVDATIDSVNFPGTLRREMGL